MFFVTSKDGKGPHDHIVYIRQDGTGVTSVDKKHSHNVIFNPPTEQQLDNGTSEVISEATEGFPSLEEADGHSHLIGAEYQTAQKDLFVIPEGGQDDLAKDKSVRRVKAIFKQARAIEKESFDDGEEAERFYEGDQWDADAKSKLEGAARAALTINEIEPKMDLLSGVQRQNRLDIRFFPTENGDNRVADILTIITKHVMGRTDYDAQESAVFEDETIVGRGAFDIDTDFDEDIRGKIVISRFNWKDYSFGPHSERNGSDADFFTKQKWLSLSKLKQMFPEKSDEIETSFRQLDDANKGDSADKGTTLQEERNPYDPNTSGASAAELVVDPEFVNITKRQFRLIEGWQKVFARVHIAVNAFDGFIESLEGIDKKDISRIKSIDGMNVIPRVIYQFRVTMIAGNTLLEDEFPDLPVIQGKQFYPITPSYAKKRRNRYWGKVKGAIDLQKEINKRHSQGVDILNRVNPYGWFYTDQTFTTPHDEKNFKESGSTPGFFQKVSSMNERPQLEQGVKYPVELANAQAMASNKMKEQMNINLELLGQQKNLSGVAIKENKRQGLLGNDFLFDNLSFARRDIALKIVAHIQKYWDVDRIIRIIGFEAVQNKEQPPQVGGQPVPENPADNPEMQAVMQILQEQDLTTYDVEVSESAQSPTAMIGNFMIMSELATQGVQIPPTTLIRLAPIPDKEKVLEELQQFTEAQQAQEDKKMNIELQKTAMAQEGRGGVRQ